MLANPAVLQMVGLFMLIGAMLVIGFLVVRSLRKDIVSDSAAMSSTPRIESANFAAAAYQGVIAGLKEREQELRLQLSAESRRAAALENVSGMVLENIGTGVMMFSSNLLVERANPAARKILGYASPLKMNVSEVFRGLQTVELPSPNGASGGITQAIRDVFTNGAEYREVPARYSTPSGDSYHLRLALLPIRESGQQVTATLCLLGTADAAFTLSLPAAEAGRNKSEAE